MSKFILSVFFPTMLVVVTDAARRLSCPVEYDDTHSTLYPGISSGTNVIENPNPGLIVVPLFWG